MATLAAGTSATVSMASGTVLDVVGQAEINFGAGRYETTGGGRYGPFQTPVTAVVLAVGPVTYQNYNLLDRQVTLDATSNNGKVDGLRNPDGSIIPIVNHNQVVLDGGVAGSDSGWLPISSFPERLAYALDSGSTATTFTIDVSADGGVTTLSQAFTGSYASSSVAEVTPPILFNAITATHFKITVTSGGPISFLRGV